MEKLLQDDLREELKKIFDVSLENNVKILIFTDTKNTEASQILRQLVNEVSELSDKIDYTEYNAEQNAKLAKRYSVKVTPAIVLLDKDGFDNGIVFYGVPFGREFNSFVNMIIEFSKTERTKIAGELKEKLDSVQKDAMLQVFVTAQCPHCPALVEEAYKLAFNSDKIYLEVLMADQFVEVAKSMNINSVPYTVINAEKSIVGRVPLYRLVEEILLVTNTAPENEPKVEAQEINQ